MAKLKENEVSRLKAEVAATKKKYLEKLDSFESKHTQVVKEYERSIANMQRELQQLYQLNQYMFG